MPSTTDHSLARALRRAARPLTGEPSDLDALVAQAGDARFVLLGTSTDGTCEFHRLRAEITKRLISEKRFAAVVVEADWPEAWRVNRYVRARSTDVRASDALADCARFPGWVWRNTDVLGFVEWLRAHNDGFSADEEKVGFYGMDLFGLDAAMATVVDYLRIVDPEASYRAARRYAFFDMFGEEAEYYGDASALGLSAIRERELLAQLAALCTRAAEPPESGARAAFDDLLAAGRHATLGARAERYYRAMFQSDFSSWNLRERHLADTLEAIDAALGARRSDHKLVVWGHVSHLGDARATEMHSRGQLSVGQLVRTRHGDDAVLVGFTTFAGSVTAASDWDGICERKILRAALPGSFEAECHESGLRDLTLALRAPSLPDELEQPRLERAVGVLYRPESERLSHYFVAQIPRQFDAVIHLDQTRAVEPLEVSPVWERSELEMPDVFPLAL